MYQKWIGILSYNRGFTSNCLEQDVCFRPLNPPLELHYALIWKRTVFQSKAAEVFLQELKQSTT